MDSRPEVGRWVWDVRANRVTWDHELFRIYGLEESELVPTFEAYLLRVHPEDRPLVEASLKAALQSNEPFNFEERIVRPDGEVRLLRSRGEVVRDEAGEVKTLTGVCQDVTSAR
jgi:PAS domain S-box-containing protein